jgi:hypothetical protein
MASSSIVSSLDRRLPYGRTVFVVVLHFENDSRVINGAAVAALLGVNAYAEAELCPLSIVGRSEVIQIVDNFGRGMGEHAGLVASVFNFEPGLVPVLVDPVATPSHC